MSGDACGGSGAPLSWPWSASGLGCSKVNPMKPLQCGESTHLFKLPLRLCCSVVCCSVWLPDGGSIKALFVVMMKERRYTRVSSCVRVSQSKLEHRGN